MKKVKNTTMGWLLPAAALMLYQTGSGFAQPGHQHPATNAPTSLEAQLNQLRAQVAELARVVQSHGTVQPQGTSGQQSGGSGMPGMSMGASAGSMGMMGMDNMMMKGGMKQRGMMGMGGSGGGMGMMDDMMMGQMGGMKKRMGGMSGMGQSGMSGGMGGMQQGGMGMMDMMGMMEDMDMMRMGGMQNMSMPSALPGFAGASHLYHIGATGFFLDHPQHIKLTTEQQVALNKMKEQAALAKNKSDREIEQAEQELWELTAADQPDVGKIEDKVRQIEKLRGDQRLDFIRSVGDAAKALTDEQRKQLVGLAAPSKAGTSSAPHTSHTP